MVLFKSLRDVSAVRGTSKEREMTSAYSEMAATLVARTRPRLSATYQLEFKNCFGAVAGYVDGCIFISCGRFGVALRLPPSFLEQLFKDNDATPLKYFPNGHVKKEYAVIPSRIIEDRQRFKKLLDKSIQYSLSK